MLTGEPLPITKRIGDKVIGATLNTNGSLIMRSEKIGSSTSVLPDRTDGGASSTIESTNATHG